MSKGYTVRPWRPILGSGQTEALTSGTAANFAAVGSETYAVAVRLAPAATAYIAFIRISGSGASAAAEKDYPISSSDPPQILACGPGDVVSVYQASGSAGTVYLCELTQ